MNSNDKITTTNELAGVIAYRHFDNPSVKVQISPDQQNDPSSKWGAFASSEGVALPYFAGKSFANQKSADRAVRKYLTQKAERHVPAAQVKQWVPSTSDDVISWSN